MSNGEPRLIIEPIQVGHGDCTLISWNNGKMKSSWNCIIDAGNGDLSNNQAISNTLDKHGINTIDLAIVSHFDTDHIGGFSALCDKKGLEIKSYWSPYTPAFRKYSWLFGSRGQKAVERATQLEEKLERNNVEMLAPLDGYVNSPAEDLKISVFSPPSKLYERLLSGREIEELFNTYPTPIGTIFDDNSDYSSEELSNPLVRGYHSRRFGNNINRDLKNEQVELSGTRNDSQSIKVEKDVICAQQDLGPEFFGNHLLNDTSLVIKIEFWLGSQWFSSLFPGDLENWIYVMKCHQPNLYSNYYKVSHHGGRVFIGKDNGLDQVFQSIRPTFSSISANGKHGLPHSSTREALVRWSSSVFCSLQKGSELFRLDGNLPIQNKCCRDTFNCRERDEGIQLIVDTNNIKIETQACQRTYTPNSLPVIQFEQHFIPDSSILSKLSEREIDKHTVYIKKYLNEIHNERTNEFEINESRTVPIEEIQSKFLQDKRHLTVTQIEKILQHGYLKGEFWSENGEYLRGDSWKVAYKLPSVADVSKMWAIFENKQILIAPIGQKGKGISSILNEVKRENLAAILESKTAYPRKLISKYVWPLLIPNIIEKFKFVYFESKYEYLQDHLLLYSRTSELSFEDIMRQIVQEIPSKYLSRSSFNSSNFNYSYYPNYVNNSDQRLLLLESHFKNKEKKNGITDEIFEIFCQFVSDTNSNTYRYFTIG